MQCSWNYGPFRIYYLQPLLCAWNCWHFHIYYLHPLLCPWSCWPVHIKAIAMPLYLDLFQYTTYIYIAVCLELNVLPCIWTWSRWGTHFYEILKIVRHQLEFLQNMIFSVKWAVQLFLSAKVTPKRSNERNEWKCYDVINGRHVEANLPRFVILDEWTKYMHTTIHIGVWLCLLHKWSMGSSL